MEGRCGFVHRNVHLVLDYENLWSKSKGLRLLPVSMMWKNFKLFSLVQELLRGPKSSPVNGSQGNPLGAKGCRALWRTGPAKLEIPWHSFTTSLRIHEALNARAHGGVCPGIERPYLWCGRPPDQIIFLSAGACYWGHQATSCQRKLTVEGFLKGRTCQAWHILTQLYYLLRKGQ